MSYASPSFWEKVIKALKLFYSDFVMMMVLIEKQRGERMKEKVERLMRKNEKTRKIDKKEGG